jgi:SlyX protein
MRPADSRTAFPENRAQSGQRRKDVPMEKRIAELEVKLSFTEDLVEELNKTVFRQQQQIEQLQKDVVAMREQIRLSIPAEKRDPRDEVPPHY